MFWDLRKIFRVCWALAKGYWVTLKYSFKPTITFQFPQEKKPIAERFRGVLSFHPEICISCDMCARVCPSDVISLKWTRNEQTKKKDLDWYQIDYAKCNVCRLCEEICPTKNKSVRHSNEYEITFDNRKDTIVRWNPSKDDTFNAGPEKQAWFRYMPDGSKQHVSTFDPDKKEDTSN